MIAPRASGAFVCLRCELRATRPRPSPSLVRRLPYANFTTSTFRRNNDSDHPDDAELPTSADPQEKGKLSAHPLGRVHKRKGKILQEKVARLHNQKTLGSEASIIVLRELADGTASSDPSEPSGPPEYDASPKEPSQSILASLKEAGSPLAQNEINQLLDGLRPEVSSAPGEPQYISRSEYQRLSSYLYDGFTVNQLSKYFAHCKGMGQNKGKEEVMADLSSMVTTAKRPIGRTPWYPGTTPLKARLPGSGDASTRAKRVNKSILVDQIVRKGWGAVLLEELESAGELEVTLKPWQVYLLNSTVNAAVSQHLGVHDPSPDATVLDCVARARKVKTEIMSSTVIRITAAKSNAEYAADDIEQLLQATETRKFRLSDWQEAGLLDKSRTPEKLIKLYDSESLEVIGKASGAYIQSVSNDTLQIRAPDKDAAEEAVRGLIRLLPLSDEVPTSVDSRRLQSRNDTSAFIPVPFPSDLAFKYRIIKLGRWTSIVPRQGGKSINNDEPHGSVEDSEASATADQMTAEKETVISKFDFSHHRRIKVGVPSNERSHWMSDSSPAIGATYQHCLFEAPQESLTSALTTQLGDLRSTKYANSNSIPGVLKLLAKDSTDFHIAFSNRTLVYRFVPSPLEQNPLRNAGDWPSLALKFSPFRGNDGLVRVKLRDVSLSTNPRRHGVLLPDRATDLDFFQCRKSKLFYPLEIDEIRQFVDAVCANIESGERLRAPPTLTLDIPRYLIPTYSEQATGTRKFTYLFESVTHKHFVHMAFEGQSVVYSTSQQGPLGQNGSTLRLFPTGLGVKGAGHRFVDTAFKLADRITEAASDPNPIGLRPKVDTRGNTIFKSIDIGRGSSKTDEVKTSVSEGHVDESSPVDEPSGVIDPEVALTTTNDVSTPENEVSTGKSSVVDEP